MTEEAPEYDKRQRHRRVRKGQMDEDEVKRCHARWWSDDAIQSCDLESVAGRRRCLAHQPDGSRLDANGVPIARATARGARR